MPSPFEAVLDRLDGVRTSGDRDAMAFCPLHPDTKGSLSVREGDDGTVVLHCFAGCTGSRGSSDVEPLLDKIGLETKDLFPDRRGLSPERGPELIMLSTSRSKPPTLAEISEHFRLSVKHLEELGYERRTMRWKKDGKSIQRTGVCMPYRDWDGELTHWKMRIALDGMPKHIYPHERGSFEQSPYGRDRLTLARSIRQLQLVEGESDVDTLAFHGIPALGIPGANAVGCLEHRDLKDIDSLWIVQEPGKGGDEFISGVSGRLAELGWQGKASVLPMPHDCKDPNELHRRDPSRFKDAYRALCGERAVPLADALVAEHFESVSDVKEEPLEFLWEPYFPLGEVTIVYGVAGDGKSVMSMGLAAQVTRGKDAEIFPSWQRDAEKVLVIHLEDSRSKVITSRFRLAGGAMEGDMLYMFRKESRQFDFGSPGNLGFLRRAIERYRPRLVIVDPAIDAISTGDTGRASKLKKELRPVQAMSQELNIAMVLIAHMKKETGKGSLIDRLAESYYLQALARSILAVVPDGSPEHDAPEGATCCRVVHAKTNLDKYGLPFSFWIGDPRPGAFHFGTFVEHAAGARGVATTTTGKPGKPGALKQGMEILEEMLNGQGSVAVTKVMARASEAGISESTMKRARARLGLVVDRAGKFAGPCYWARPSSLEKEEDA